MLGLNLNYDGDGAPGRCTHERFPLPNDLLCGENTKLYWHFQSFLNTEMAFDTNQAIRYQQITSFTIWVPVLRNPLVNGWFAHN